MDLQLLVLCGLTFVIHLIGTLAYSVRIAGVRTRRIAVSLALFSMLALLSRTSNAFLGPYLGKRVEQHLTPGGASALFVDFQWLLLSATLATIAGALLIPTFQRLFSRAVLHFQTHRSIPKLAMHAVFKGGIGYVRDAVRVPAAANIVSVRGHGISPGITMLNVVAVALLTTGVFAAYYAGALDPAVRLTSSSLSGIINGVATIAMALFIDPHMSGMTDDVIDGRVSETQFRKAVVWLVGSRLAGTVLAQVLLLPAALLIATVARVL
ncbi:MAG: lipid II flippase Amj family protein [Asticcacaulis sp.]|nr:lipid II flippase Amj family protein [Asticcacaulis sp.]